MNDHQTLTDHQRERVREDMCPRCPGELDTGWECNWCGYDAKWIVHEMNREKLKAVK